MTSTLPTGRIRYAEKKVEFLRAETEQWRMDYGEAIECYECEDVVRDANLLLNDIYHLDQTIQAAYCEGRPHSPEIDERLKALFARWYEVSVIIEASASWFEKKSYAVDGVIELRHGMNEVEAILDSSDTLSGPIEDLGEMARAADDRGETIEGLID